MPTYLYRLDTHVCSYNATIYMWTGQHAQKLTMLVRAINYNLGKQMFTVVFLTHLEGIATISQAVKMDGDMVQSGVVGISVGMCCTCL